MGETTEISWTDHTFNAWIGCTAVSPACDSCYAEKLVHRYGWAEWGAGKPRKRTSESYWKQPLAWNRKASREGVRRRVFCCSLADVFDAEVSDAWRLDLMQLIHATPSLEWLLLTKRPQVAAKFFVHQPVPGNARLGITAENQKMLELRAPIILAIEQPLLPFISAEPLLGPLALRNFRVCDSCGETPFNLFKNDPLCPQPMPPWDGWQCPLHYWPSSGCDGKLKSGFSWVIAGGESGPRARPMHSAWVRSLRDQCQATGVAFHFKQWGEYAPHEAVDNIRGLTCSVVTLDGRHLTGDAAVGGERGGDVVVRAGKGKTGAKLDGKEWREFPT